MGDRFPLLRLQGSGDACEVVPNGVIGVRREWSIAASCARTLLISTRKLLSELDVERAEEVTDQRSPSFSMRCVSWLNLRVVTDQ